MKIELPKSVAQQLREPLARCHDASPPSVLAGQVMRGYWDEGGTDKLFLFLCAIKPSTALKIRKLIERDRDRETLTPPTNCNGR